jgi:hypothetical protein
LPYINFIARKDRRNAQVDSGDVHTVLKTSERAPRNILSKLVQEGFLKSATPKGPVRIAFPLDYRDRLFPSLFAEAVIDAPEPPAVSFGR